MSIRLTRRQRNIVDDATRFIHNSSSGQVFEYGGYAGTGKSVVMNAIADECGIPRHRIAPMSYIGQAAIVMRTKGLLNAKTIHSWLFTPVEKEVLDEKGNVQMDPYFNIPKTETQFTADKILDNIDVIFVDEGYSVPIELKPALLKTGKKIIVSGDPGQLPPPKSDPAFLTDTDNYYILDEILRQGPGSSIVHLADRARKGLPIHYGYYGNSFVIDQEELNDALLGNALVTICFTNKTRDYINNRVRHDIYHINSKLPVVGERMVCRKNNWNIEVDNINLANGLLGEVTDSQGVYGFNGKQYTISFKPYMTNQQFENLKCDYEYLTAPVDKKNLFKNNRFNTAEKFEFAYAITCHMAQGGQFSNGIYIEEYGREIQNNLNYTGITRFQNNFIYVKRKKKKFY